tara:strand:- start:10333 stop:10533 length:201 start_codon:yes stop_codon:yes gene_type:complete
MVEQTISGYLRSLPHHEVSNLKAHANAASHEDHPSFKELQRWAAAVLGMTIGAGTMWKVIKTIQHH